MSIKPWLSAFRLRTLPLAFSSIVTGSALAYYHFSFNVWIFSLALLTTLFLQILSNLSNDYGDSKNGVDNKNRVGPARAVQSGAIQPQQMKNAMILFVVLSLASGIPLIFIALKNIGWQWIIGFLILGISAIIAAIKYTAGKNPYGYKGYGDVFVFIFFGLTGVIGTCFLQTHQFSALVIFPAVTIGCWSAAVLNLNNLRDIENDRACGKNTLVVKMGWKAGKMYQTSLILLGISSMVFFAIKAHFNVTESAIFLAPSFLLLIHIFKVLKTQEPKNIDPELKKVALSTFLFSLLFFLSIFLNY